MSGWLAQYQQKEETPKPVQLSPTVLFFQGIRKGNLEQCKQQLAHIDKATAVDGRGNPPSMVALDQHMWHVPPLSDKWARIIEFLGEKGFDLNRPNRHGWTVLQVCARNRDNVCPHLLTTIKKYVGNYHP